DAESSERSAGEAPALRSEDSASRLHGCAPRVTDFGLAKHLDPDEGHTHTGQVLGTPSYMAPEQAAGKPGAIGPAPDVSALAAGLSELLPGRPRFKGASLRETLDQVCSSDPVPPRALNPATPRDLETICLKCLEKEPGRRYPGARELADDLGRYLDGRPVQARPLTPAGRLLRWGRRNPRVATLAAARILVGTGGFVGVTSLWLGAPPA